MWVALIACSRIILNRQYIPCSLYQTCLVRDIHRQRKMQLSPIANKEGGVIKRAEKLGRGIEKA